MNAKAKHGEAPHGRLLKRAYRVPSATRLLYMRVPPRQKKSRFLPFFCRSLC